MTILNGALITSPENWLRVLLMAGAAAVVFHLVARAIPAMVPTEN